MAFADKTSELIVEKNSESPTDLSLSSEFAEQVANISRPGFSGIWVRDESANDDLNETMKEAQQKGTGLSKWEAGGCRGGGGASGENYGEKGMSARSKRGK